MLHQAQLALDERYKLYEDLAARDGSRFLSALGERMSQWTVARRYLGLRLEHPIIASASPLTATRRRHPRARGSRRAAVVMPSLFEEQIQAEDTAYAMYTDMGRTAKPRQELLPRWRTTTGAVRGTSTRCAGSRLGRHSGHRQPQRGDAGRMDDLRGEARRGGRGSPRAQHLFHPDRTHDERTARSRSHYVEAVVAVKRTVKIPVAVKLSQFFSSIGTSRASWRAPAADGLVLFNRFYQPDFDLRRWPSRRN